MHLKAAHEPQMHSRSPEVELVPLSDTQGRMVFLPRPVVDTLIRSGIRRVTVEIDLMPDGAPTDWLTVKAAALEHMSDVDGLTLDAAFPKVSRAASAGKFVSVGTGRSRRIEPTSFRAWRLEQRERDLAKSEDS